MGAASRWFLLAGIPALFMILAFAASAKAAWTSPGTGQTYDLALLETDSGGEISFTVPPCDWVVSGVVTISNNDTLGIAPGCRLFFDINTGLVIQGRLNVSGTAAYPVLFESNRGAPAAGDYDGVDFQGAAFAPSYLDNLTINHSTFGLRCAGCSGGLSVANLAVNANSGDALLVAQGGRNIRIAGLSLTLPSTSASQSVLGVNNGSNITGGALSGTNVAVVVVSWNATNITLGGPIAGTGIGRFLLWIDNAANISLTGGSATGANATVLVSRSGSVTLANLSLAGTVRTALDVRLSGPVWISNATLSATALPLSINQSNYVVVNDTTVSGGSPANAFVNGSVNVTMRNVNASGGAQGFLVQSSPNFALIGGNATGASIEGVRVIGSGNLLIDGTRISGNAGRGLWINGSTDATVRNAVITGNAREGVFASATTFRLIDTAVYLNTLDGVVATNASAMNATNLQAFSNGREGIWLSGGVHRLAGATVRANAANGTRVEAGRLDLVDGIFENNSLLGISYAAGTTGAWAVTAAATLQNNDAVLAGGLLVDGGRFRATNASLAFRGAYDLRARNGGAIAMDDVQLSQAVAGVSDFYFTILASGQLWLNRTVMNGPGAVGGEDAVNAHDGYLGMANVSILNPGFGVELYNSTGLLSDVFVLNPLGGGLSALLGSTVLAIRLTVDGAPQLGVWLNGSLVDLRGGRILNTGTPSFGAGIESDLADLRLTDTVVDGANIAVAVNGGAFAGTNITILNVTVGLQLVDAQFACDGLFADLSGASVPGEVVYARNTVGSLGNATLLNGPNLSVAVYLEDSNFTSVDLTVTGGAGGFLTNNSLFDGLRVLVGTNGTAFWADESSNITLRSATLTSQSGNAIGVANASALSIWDSHLRSVTSTALYARLAATISGSNATLEAPSATAVGVDGADSFTMEGLDYYNCAGGVLLLSVLDVSIANATGVSDGTALEAISIGSIGLSNGNYRSNASYAVRLDTIASATLTDIVAAGSFAAVSLTGVNSLFLVRFNLTAASGPALILGASAGAVLSHGDLVGTSASTVTGSAGASLDNLTFWGDSLAVDFSSGLSLVDAAFYAGAIWLTNSTDIVVDGLTVRAPAGVTGVSLGVNGSATMRHLDLVGGAYGLYGAGGPYLEVRDSAAANQTIVALWARSYARVLLDNVSAAGAPTGIDLRYIPALTATALVSAGSTINALNVDRCDNATLNATSLAPANGTGLRLVASASVALDGLTVAGGSLGVSLNATVGTRISNATVSGAARGISATNASTAVLQNARFMGGTTAGVEADNNSTLDLWNGVIASAAGAPAFRAVDATTSAFVRLFDTPADNATFNHASNAAIEVYWSLRVVVRSSGAPQSGVTVAVRDRAAASVGSAVSNASGLAFFGYLLELRDGSAGRVYFSPFNASATLGVGFSAAASFDLTAPSTVIIDLLDTQAPTLELRPTPRLHLGGTYTFWVDAIDRDNVGIVRYVWAFDDGSGTPQLVESASGPGFAASHTYNVSGFFSGTVTAFDAAGNSFSRPFSVSVNSPPYFLRLAPVSNYYAFVGVAAQFDFTASDNDTADVGSLSITVSGSPSASIQGGFLFITPSVATNIPLTVTVSDGLDATSFSFVLLVGTLGGPNAPPVFTSTARLDANISFDYVYSVTVSDPESDPVVIQLLAAPEGMTFTQVLGQPTGQLFWRPSTYYSRTVGELTANLSVSLRAWDGKGTNFAYQNFTVVLKNPPDQAPLMLDFEDFTLTPGEVRTLNLSLFASDPDDPASTLTWSIIKPSGTEGATIGFDTEDPDVLVIRAPDTIEGTRSFTVQFVVKDSSGLSTARPVVITLKGPTVAETAFPWLLLLVIVGGVGAAFAIATRQRAASLAEELATTRSSTTGSGASQTMVPAGDAGFPIYLEGAALFDRSDNILVSASADGRDLDDVFVMLPAVGRETGVRDGSLSKGRVGGREVAFLRQGDAVLAAVGKFAGDPAPWLEDPMKLVLDQVQARGSELNVQDLEQLGDDPGVVEAVKGLLAISAGSSPEAVAKYARETALRAASVVELVQGLVRLKVAVDNNSGQIAADVRLSVEFDDKVMRLERMEPTVELRRDKVQLGNLRPTERKTVAFYFDPQICARTFFNATVSWEDGRGAFHSTTMRTRAAEVVCPAFSTPTEANTAMLKRMLKEELAFRDSKYFRFPGQTSAEQVFESCKQAVLAQDVRLVREFVTERPFRAEAWFYGETKVKKSPTVIWTAVFGMERVAQFSVASGAHGAITGLLAELGRRLVDSRAGGGIGAPIETMKKAEAAAEIGDRATLLSKSQSAENETD